MDGFAKNILDFNKQLTLKALRFSNLQKLKGRPDAIVVCGMGGSGTVADLLQGLAKSANITVPIISWKDYGLPEISYKNPLYLFVSFSGGTQETISGFIKSQSYKLKGVVSGGGKLIELAKTSKTPLANFDCDTLAPRQANGLMLYGTLGIIKSVLPETKTPDFSAKIKPKRWGLTGKKLAEQIAGKIPLIYAANRNKHLGYFWKINFNETAKIHAFSNVLPEMNHNEIVGFELKPKNFSVLLLRDPAEDAIHQKRFKITESVLKKIGTPAVVVNLKGADAFEKTFNSMTLAEWTSYYVAKLNRIDPKETKIIEEIKKML